MSYRIEDKLFFKPKNILQFKNFLTNKSAKKLYDNRIIRSLYFDNINLCIETQLRVRYREKKLGSDIILILKIRIII